MDSELNILKSLLATTDKNETLDYERLYSESNVHFSSQEIRQLNQLNSNLQLLISDDCASFSQSTLDLINSKKHPLIIPRDRYQPQIDQSLNDELMNKAAPPISNYRYKSGKVIRRDRGSIMKNRTAIPASINTSTPPLALAKVDTMRVKCFSVEPNPLVIANDTQTPSITPFSVHNHSSRSHRLHFLPHKSAIFSIRSDTFPTQDSGLIASGMSHRFLLHFSPALPIDYAEVFDAVSDSGETIHVAVKALRNGPRLDLSNVEYELGPICRNFTMTHVFESRSLGGGGSLMIVQKSTVQALFAMMKNGWRMGGFVDGGCGLSAEDEKVKTFLHPHIHPRFISSNADKNSKIHLTVACSGGEGTNEMDALHLVDASVVGDDFTQTPLTFSYKVLDIALHLSRIDSFDLYNHPTTTDYPLPINEEWLDFPEQNLHGSSSKTLHFANPNALSFYFQWRFLGDGVISSDDSPSINDSLLIDNDASIHNSSINFSQPNKDSSTNILPPATSNFHFSSMQGRCRANSTLSCPIRFSPSMIREMESATVELRVRPVAPDASCCYKNTQKSSRVLLLHLKGKCVPYTVQVTPPSFPLRFLNLGHPTTYTTFHLHTSSVNFTRVSVAVASECVNGTVVEVETLEPKMIILAPQKSMDVTVGLKGVGVGEFNGEIKFSIDDGPSISIPISILVQPSPDDLFFESSIMDLGVVEVGGTRDYSVFLVNRTESPLPIQLKLRPHNSSPISDCGPEVAETLTILPPSTTMPPRSRCEFKLIWTPSEPTSQLRSHLSCFIPPPLPALMDSTEWMPMTCATLFHACQEFQLKITTTPPPFISVIHSSSQSSFVLANLSCLQTPFQLQPITTEFVSITFDPSNGCLGALSMRKIHVVVDMHRVTQTMKTRECLLIIPSSTLPPITFFLDYQVMELEIGVFVGGGVERMSSTGYLGSVEVEQEERGGGDVGTEIDFGECLMFSRCIKEISLENATAAPTTFSIDFTHFAVDEDILTAVDSQFAYSSHTDTSHLSHTDSPHRPHELDWILLNASSNGMGFQSHQGQKYAAAQSNARRFNKVNHQLLQNKSGIAFVAHPRRGELKANSKLHVKIMCVSDMWGEFDDEIIIRYGSDASKKLPVRAKVFGCPVKILSHKWNERSHSGHFAFPDQLNGTRTTHQLHLQNFAAKPIWIKWDFHETVEDESLNYKSLDQQQLDHTITEIEKHSTTICSINSQISDSNFIHSNRLHLQLHPTATTVQSIFHILPNKNTFAATKEECSVFSTAASIITKLPPYYKGQLLISIDPLPTTTTATSHSHSVLLRGELLYVDESNLLHPSTPLHATAKFEWEPQMFAAPLNLFLKVKVHEAQLQPTTPPPLLIKSGRPYQLFRFTNAATISIQVSSVSINYPFLKSTIQGDNHLVAPSETITVEIHHLSPAPPSVEEPYRSVTLPTNKHQLKSSPTNKHQLTISPNCDYQLTFSFSHTTTTQQVPLQLSSQ